MAALQSIRRHGALLVGAIGLALFAFIAEEFFRSLETSSAVSKQQAGSVYGEKISIQDYQQLVEEATEVMKIQQGTDNLTEDQQQQVRDQVWQTYVSNKIIEHEATKLGLIVTDEEVQNALAAGTAQSLTQLSYFVNPQTGRFDYTGLQNFFKEYEKAKNTQMSSEQMETYETIKRMWNHAERGLRAELLGQKYQALLFGSFVGNNVAAKEFFANSTTTSTALVASIAASTIDDKTAKAEDADVKAEYEKYKELFFQESETRDLKIIDVQVLASEADRKALDEKMAATYQQILAGEDLAAVVGAANSEVRYVDAPMTKAAFPYDIRQQLDSLSAGATKAPYYNAGDNTLNIIRLVSRQELPDSVLYRAIGVPGSSEEDAATRADSIMKALQAGGSFRTLAEKYGQRGDSLWVTSAQLQQGQIDESGAKFITTLATAGTGSLQKVDLNGNKVILQILDRKAFTTKYNAAVVKVAVDFSKDTYNAELNKFNRFIAQNRTLADIEKNASKAGYLVREIPEFASNAVRVANIGGTKDAIRWIFDEADKDDVSKLYECGDAKDHLLLIAVSDVHEAGYRAWDDKNVKEVLTTLANATVKSEAAFQKLASAKTIAEAQKLGAAVDTVQNISFLGMPYIPSAGVAEPIVSGAVAKMKQGQTTTVKGGNGAYVVQLLSTEQNKEQKFEAKQTLEQVAQMDMRMAGQSLFQTLLRKAKVVDNRYKF